MNPHTLFLIYLTSQYKEQILDPTLHPPTL